MEPKDLALLVSLDAILQEGSVTGAARRLGLSTPAMSHTLARIRERLGDPILVRSGRGMLLTPRALSLKAQVHGVVTEARRRWSLEVPPVAAELSRTFVVHDRLCPHHPGRGGGPHPARRGAEGGALQPNTLDDPARSRSGLGSGGRHLRRSPLRRCVRQLLTDRFVAVVAQGAPRAGKRWTLEQFARVPHIQVAPRESPAATWTTCSASVASHARSPARCPTS
ncbi:MAG: LysR family transcriptional regulator [Polyangiaceae bacterium]